MVKNLPANAREVRGLGLIDGSGGSPEEGNGNPLQYACLENPMDRQDWRVTVHSIAKSQTEVTYHHTVTYNHTSHFLYVSRYYEWGLSLSQDALGERNCQYVGKNNSQI